LEWSPLCIAVGVACWGAPAATLPDAFGVMTRTCGCSWRQLIVGRWWLGWRVDIAELSERLEKLSVRYGELLGFERDPDWFLLKLQEEVGELTQAYLQHTGRARTKGLSAEQIRDTFHQEFADVFCQLLLLARQYDVDLPGEIERKWLAREI
jgi:NTP pyrophosphatase (non-canonical NTP hydrolase)